MQTNAPTPPADIIAVAINGEGRAQTHGPVELDLGLMFFYRPAYPYEVKIHLIETDDIARYDLRSYANRVERLSGWQVCRGILRDAAIRDLPAGLSDFEALPMAETVQLVFHATERGQMPLHVDVGRRPLAEFLARTTARVPLGTESALLDIDRVIANLLGKAIR